MSGVVFKAEALYCERDFRLLFDQLSFTVSAGDVVQIVGHNGVGKTSLLRGIYGLNADVKGDFYWFDEAWPSCRYTLAERSLFLGHHAGVKAALSPRENLRWYFDLRQPVTIDRIDEALEKVGLAGYEETPCTHLSAGQHRRVALARLHLSEANVWILDEPFTAIDLDGVLALERQIEAFAANGGAVLLTSHHTLTQIPRLRQLDLEAYRTHG